MTAVQEISRPVPRQEASPINGHKPTPFTPQSMGEMRRDPKDPKRIADKQREDKRREIAEKWAAENYGHNNRMKEALLKSLKASPPIPVFDRSNRAKLPTISEAFATLVE